VPSAPNSLLKGFPVTIETVEIIEKLMEIQLNEVYDRSITDVMSYLDYDQEIRHGLELN